MTRAMIVVLAVAFALLPETAAAQRRGGGGGLFQGALEAGLRTGRDFENHAWSLGALMRIPFHQKLELRPSADAFFPEHGKTGWQANGDADIMFGPGRTVYGGGGIALVNLDGRKTWTGYNLFFGLIPAQAEAKTKPFVEFRWTFVNNTSPFRLVAGATHRIGG